MDHSRCPICGGPLELDPALGIRTCPRPHGALPGLRRQLTPEEEAVRVDWEEARRELEEAAEAVGAHVIGPAPDEMDALRREREDLLTARAHLDEGAEASSPDEPEERAALERTLRYVAARIRYGEADRAWTLLSLEAAVEAGSLPRSALETYKKHGRVFPRPES